jgi:hypothetical protein
MPQPLPPGNYDARFLGHPSTLKPEEQFGVLVPASSNHGNQPARIIVFSERRQWERYIRNMAQQGRQWRDFTPIVFKPIQMGVVMIDAAGASEAVETVAADVNQPIDSRLELLAGED